MAGHVLKHKVKYFRFWMFRFSFYNGTLDSISIREKDLMGNYWRLVWASQPFPAEGAGRDRRKPPSCYGDVACSSL